jgi:hypothetical protein
MDIIIHILQILPDEYENTVELLENNLENEVANLDRVKESLGTNLIRYNNLKSILKVL